MQKFSHEKLNSESQPVIIVRNLKKSYGKIKVLEGINFNVHRGEILALLGPNGAGKTTTVKILSTLTSPDSGEISINGFDVVSQPSFVRSSIGLTGQFAAVDDYFNAEENLELIGRLYRMNYDDIKRRSKELLQRFDLMEAASRPVKTYSGGMRRRLDLAMSLIASPPVVFLDEPTTGLDPPSRLTMWKIVEELAAAGITILLTTQHMEEADYLADKIIVIDKGKIIAEGTPEKLKAQIGSDYIEFKIAEQSNFQIINELFKHETIHIDSKRRIVNIATKNGAKDLKHILLQLEKSEIEIESLSLHHPTLDDVFLSLTGHAAVKETEENDKNDNQNKKVNPKNDQISESHE